MLELLLLMWRKVYNEPIVLLDYIHRLVSQKIEELKICTKYHNTHVQKYNSFNTNTPSSESYRKVYTYVYN
jgi:hypothetical protein